MKLSTMKNISISLFVAGLAFSIGAVAENMSEDQYKAQEKNIEADYKAAKAKCDSLAGNAKDICIEEAKGQEKIAKAELEATYKPSAKTHYEARVAKAYADYAVAKERCDDKAGNAKDVCVKEAKAAKTRQVADAKAERKTSEANADANATSGEASAKAKEKATDARKDAAQEKRDADYGVAKEKCDALAGSAKDRCLSEAKTRFGQ